MSERKMHLRPNTVINIGRTKTYCGRVLYPIIDGRGEMTGFDSLDATVHGALVTCERCLPGTFHSTPSDRTTQQKDRP